MAERESTSTKFIPTVSATASAAEIVRSFSHWRDVAGKQPVFITNHGRETHVLLDIDDYHGLRAEESSGPAGARSDSEDLVGLAKWIEDALLVCDRELRVEYVNRVASAACRTAASDLIGRSLLEALPAITGTLMEVHTRRTVLSGQPSAADIPSPFSDGAWLHFQSFPLGSRNILMFRDITEDVQRHRLADVKTAILDAMTVHGGVGYVRLSVRGMIERIDEPFSRMVDLDERRLIGIALIDLIVREERVAFREQLESVLRGGAPQRVDIGFLSNTGAVARARVSIVQLHGAYGGEGAVVLMTPCAAGVGD